MKIILTERQFRKYLQIMTEDEAGYNPAPSSTNNIATSINTAINNNAVKPDANGEKDFTFTGNQIDGDKSNNGANFDVTATDAQDAQSQINQLKQKYATVASNPNTRYNVKISSNNNQ